MEEKDSVIITIKEVPQQNGEPGFDVKFHNETVGMSLLLDLGSYFTGLVRGQVIRTRPPELEQMTSDEGDADSQSKNSQSKNKKRVAKPSPRR